MRNIFATSHSLSPHDHCFFVGVRHFANPLSYVVNLHDPQRTTSRIIDSASHQVFFKSSAPITFAHFSQKQPKRYLYHVPINNNNNNNPSPCLAVLNFAAPTSPWPRLWPRRMSAAVKPRLSVPWDLPGETEIMARIRHCNVLSITMTADSSSSLFFVCLITAGTCPSWKN